VHLARVDLRQRARQEIGLLLVVAFEDDAVAGRDQGFQKGDDVARRDDTAVGDGGCPRQAPGLVGAPSVPLARGVSVCICSSSSVAGSESSATARALQ